MTLVVAWTVVDSVLEGEDRDEDGSADHDDHGDDHRGDDDDDHHHHGGGDDDFQFCDVALGLISCPPVSRL